MKKYAFVLFFLILINGCSDLGNYTFTPNKNLEVKVELKNIKDNEVLYFDYKIINKSSTEYHFRFDSIKVEFNGKISSSIYYNSIASVNAKIEQISEGEKVFTLYAIFSKPLISKLKNDLNLLHYGFIY